MIRQKLDYSTIVNLRYGNSFKGHQMHVNCKADKDHHYICISNAYYSIRHDQVYDINKNETRVSIIKDSSPKYLQTKLNDARVYLNENYKSFANFPDQFLKICITFNNYTAFLSDSYRSFTFSYDNTFDGMCLTGHVNNIEEIDRFRKEEKIFKQEFKDISAEQLALYFIHNSSCIEFNETYINLEINKPFY